MKCEFCSMVVVGMRRCQDHVTMRKCLMETCNELVAFDFLCEKCDKQAKEEMPLEANRTYVIDDIMKWARSKAPKLKCEWCEADALPLGRYCGMCTCLFWNRGKAPLRELATPCLFRGCKYPTVLTENACVCPEHETVFVPGTGKTLFQDGLRSTYAIDVEGMLMGKTREEMDAIKLEIRKQTYEHIKQVHLDNGLPPITMPFEEWERVMNLCSDAQGRPLPINFKKGLEVELPKPPSQD